MTQISRFASITAALLLSTAAIAATGDFKKVDANADGKITLEEGMKLHPDWTAETGILLLQKRVWLTQRLRQLGEFHAAEIECRRPRPPRFFNLLFRFSIGLVTCHSRYLILFV